MTQKRDTIVAISTPLGEGGIGIVRLSGSESLRIADRIFRGENRPSRCPTHTLHYGHIFQNGEVVDEVLLTVMRSPRTYTREDIIEINCHGGIVPLGMVLDLALKEGARLAEPGEFTKRAFLNGRIDLAQAEAVVDVIRARTGLSLKAAISQLNGDLSGKVEEVRTILLHLVAQVEATCDFPEEEVGILSRQELERQVSEMVDSLGNLIATARCGKILREGIKAVICGRTNVGKSTLFNALLGESRAIVSAAAGTTRDTIEETVNVKGFPLKLVDTAGLRETRGNIGKESVARSRRSMEESDLILLVLDGYGALSEEDTDIMQKVNDRVAIVVINKMDRPQKVNLEQVKESLPGKRIVKVSATHQAGLPELRQAIVDMFWQGDVPSPEMALVSNARHRDALLKARESLMNAMDSLRSQVPLDFIALDLRASLNGLEEIVGETATEDILAEIFSHFCIGK